jgi:hypothetical protein
MTDVPGATPVTAPVFTSTVATEVLLLVHVPPGVPSLSGETELRQTFELPAMAVGNAFTMMFLLAMQPVGNVYMILATPVEAAVTTPVLTTMVAMEVLLQLHVPPAVASLKRVVPPIQRVVVPIMPDGRLFTVTKVVVEQPETTEYVIVAVPGEKPVTTPPLVLIVATMVLLLLHVPPATVLLNIVVPPKQMPVVPDIPDGGGLMVTNAVAVQPPDSVYVMTAVPADTPLTTPVTVTTVATDVFAVLHVPPVTASLKPTVSPTQVRKLPVIAAGEVFTVTGTEAIQPATIE